MQDLYPHSSLYPKSLSPIQLSRRISLKNRVYFAPMGIDVAHTDGRASDEFIQFYQGIIAGGAGMVVLGNASVAPDTRLQQRGLSLHHEAHAEALSPLFEYGRDHDCEVVVQLQHYGAQGSTALTSAPLLSPSGIPCQRMQKSDPNYRLKVMDESDIRAVRRQFVAAAGQAKYAGARMIQLQASNGYLLSSFLSPYTNKRTDAYGGTPRKRMQMLKEVVSDIRCAYPDLAVSVRLGIDDGLGAVGQMPGLIAPCMDILEALGVVAITVSISIGETFHMLVSPTDDVRQHIASGIHIVRKYTTLPIGFAGMVSSLEDAENTRNILGVDMVGMTRALFADNDLIIKTIRGDTDNIHHCRFDGHCFRDKSNPKAERVFCCVNPMYPRPSHITY